jgi:lysophospholipase L1-like esterase
LWTTAVNEKLLAVLTRVRLCYALLMALLLFVVLDVYVRRLERTPNLVLRSEGESHFALPYMLEQIEQTRDRPVVVALGASVTQGVGNTTPQTAWPAVLEKLLERRGAPARVFNFASIGNGVGDNLALAVEAVRRGADVLVVSLHFKLFSNLGALGFALCNRDLCYYLRDRDDFAELRRRFMVSSREYWAIWLDQTGQSRWAFYREIPLVTFLLTGRVEPLPGQLRKLLLPATERRIATLLDEFGTPEKRNRDNLWQLQPDAYRRENVRAYNAVDLSPDDMHFQVLRLIGELSAEQGIKIVFFLNPLNRAMNERYRFWSWDQHAQFARLTYDIARADGNAWADLTDAVDNRYFTDGDHLNMNGHAQLAAALVRPLLTALQGARP